jgi:endonuclease YncB( thermonuclease family)
MKYHSISVGESGTKKSFFSWGEDITCLPKKDKKNRNFWQNYRFLNLRPRLNNVFLPDLDFAAMKIVFFIWITLNVLNLTLVKAENWKILNGVTLSDSRFNDGDSFRVKHDSREYIFRIYGVDCPETDMSFPDRVEDQAREFGLSPSDMVQWGDKASARTRILLGSSFQVITKWEDALGRSHLPRYYAYIILHNEGDLGAILLSEGLARVRGKTPPVPPSFPRVGSVDNYQNLQKQARSFRKGIWSAQSLMPIYSRSKD